MEKTVQQFEHIVNVCREVFIQKMKDYGTAWRVLRPKSMTDQIYIKAQRVRSIEEKGASKVSDDVKAEYIGIVNYCSMALIQLRTGPSDEDLQPKEAEKLFLNNLNEAKKLMLDKNHDYDEAWRQMRISSYTDLILMKIKRTKQIEDNDGQTLISEGVDANYLDMINYAIFALIKLELWDE